MKVLIIGGTGTISTAVVNLLVKQGHEVFVLNRGKKKADIPEEVHRIKADCFDQKCLENALSDMTFDVACHFVAKKLEQLEPAVNFLSKKVGQFVFISSASAYEKPVRSLPITEETALSNPYWQYSKDKIECEAYLMKKYEEGFPVTIVRPSHTYCEKSVPMGIHGKGSTYQSLKRMIEGKTVIVHDDGLCLWTMTDSRDFAKAFVGLLGNKKALGQAYHITSDQSISWNEIYQDIADALTQKLGRQIEFVPCYVSSDTIIKEGRAFGYDFEGTLLGDKANSVVFDNSKVKAMVPGFEATISHKEGTKRAVEYVLSHSECQDLDPDFDAFCDHLNNLK